MKLLAELTERSVGAGEGRERLDGMYKLRKSARAIILNDKGEMAIQFLQTEGVHKLPGGGIEENETPEEALTRELREEVGCESIIVRPLGMVIEYRVDKLQVSYGYVATVASEIGEVSLSPSEVVAGHVTQWLPPAACLTLLQEEKLVSTQALFSLTREITFLEEYLATI